MSSQGEVYLIAFVSGRGLCGNTHSFSQLYSCVRSSWPPNSAITLFMGFGIYTPKLDADRALPLRNYQFSST